MGLASCGVAQEAIFLDLPGESLFPEGITSTRTGDLYVTGFGNGSVLKITDGVNVEIFKEAGEDGLSSAVGLAVDETRSRLWIANFTADGANSDLKVYDLTTGELLASLAEADDAPHFFNEVVLDADGNAYVSDTLAPVIWRADADLSGVKVFVENPLLDNPDADQPFSLNGLALTPDRNTLIASVMDRIDQGDGRLVRIDIASKAVSDVDLTGSEGVIASFGGSDGMFFTGGNLFMVNVTPPAAIITAQFNDDYSSAELVARNTFESVYNRPTSSALRDGRLWTVNSQLDHIIDDENGALNTPPDVPFQLVGVPLDALLGQGTQAPIAKGAPFASALR